MKDEIIFLVTHPNTNNVAIVTGKTREDAKSRAHRHIGYPSDDYVVTPLTEPGQGVFVDLVYAPRSYS